MSIVLADKSGVDYDNTNRIQTALLPTQQVSCRDYVLDVAKGLVAGASVRTLAAYNPTVGTSYEPIWAQSGSAYPFLTAATTVTVSSSNAADTSAGAGAQTVTIQYLKSDYTLTTASYALNGQTAVTVDTDCLRVNSVEVATWGGGGIQGANVGTIYVGYGTVTAGVPANILSSIVVGENKAQQSIYTVPAGRTAAALGFRLYTTDEATINLKHHLVGAGGFISDSIAIVNGDVTATQNVPAVYPEKTDLIVMAKSSAGTVAASMVAELLITTN